MLRSRRPRASLSRVVVAISVVIAATWAAGVASAAPSLPDGRGYELVSPAQKDGGEIIAESTRSRVASDGSAASFSSLAGVGDVGGSGIAFDYISRRTGASGTSGWATHGIMPALDPLSFPAAVQSMDSLYTVLSPDLTKGILRTYTSVTPAPNVMQVANLYLRSTLLSPGAAGYELLSDCATCVAPLPSFAGAPSVVDTTPDMQHVVFESNANLVSGVTGTRAKVYEWDHGTVRFVGILPDATVGKCPNGQACSFGGSGASVRRYTPNMISDDGSRIFFSVPATNSANATGGKLFMRSGGATTVQINASEKASPDAPVAAMLQTASADGSVVFFLSPEQLTDTTGAGLYAYDATLPDGDPHNLTLLSEDLEPGDGGATDGVIGASADGRTIYFLATGQLVAGEPIIAGAGHGIFRWRDGVVTYIGLLTAAIDNLPTGSNTLAHNGVQNRLTARVTPDGRYLLFSSHSGNGLPGAYDHGVCNGGDGCTEMYLYDADADMVKCVSCKAGGEPAISNAAINATANQGGSGPTSYVNRAITADGRRVFFDTGEALVSQDRNGTVRDVYEYEVATEQLHLLSAGTSDADSYFLDASESGNDVFIATRQQLVGWDIDSNYDVYDVRVNGGLPDPVAPPIECTGDACQGALMAPPIADTSRSALFFEGNDNVKPNKPRAIRCKKGKVRKRGHGHIRCVTKQRRGEKGKRAGQSAHAQQRRTK